MTTVREIITNALEEANEVAMGDTPSPEEAERGLFILQSLYDEWVDGGLFGRFNDVRITEDYTAYEFDRVLNTAASVVTLPDAIIDAYTGDTRAPIDRAIVAVLAPATARQVSIYDANSAAWVRLDALTLDDDAPLASRGAHGLGCVLAKRIAGGRVTLSAQSEAIAAKFMVNLTAKNSSPRRETQADYF